MGAYEHDVVVVIKMGAYIHGVLILYGCLFCMGAYYLIIPIIATCTSSDMYIGHPKCTNCRCALQLEANL